MQSSIRRRASDRLRALRIEHGFTQRDFARALGVSANHLYRIESGERDATLDLIEKAASVLGVSVSSFLEVDEPHVERHGAHREVKNWSFDEDGRLRPCSNCGEDRYGNKARYCPMCGWALFNFCIGAERHINRRDAKRCEVCGQPTWWSFESQEQIDELNIPPDIRSSRSIEVAQEIT